ncbi:MAG: VRR-NUC domain-containing protein [Bacteroidales bacterium]|nr:VRR-NUC domain-containing protein [Bacteroidales bacterium]
MREYVVENEFVKAVRKAGGVAYKLTSQTANGLPDRLVLFPPAKCLFVELKAPGKMLRPLQRKRRHQLMALGFPVLCIDRVAQIKPAIRAMQGWKPGGPFPEGVGAKVPDLEVAVLPHDQGRLDDLDDYGETLEPIDPSELEGFSDLDDDRGEEETDEEA